MDAGPAFVNPAVSCLDDLPVPQRPDLRVVEPDLGQDARGLASPFRTDDLVFVTPRNAAPLPSIQVIRTILQRLAG